MFSNLLTFSHIIGIDKVQTSKKFQNFLTIFKLSKKLQKF